MYFFREKNLFIELTFEQSKLTQK